MIDELQHPPTIDIDGACLRPLRMADADSLYGAMKAIEEAGLQIPRQVSVIGFDDVPMASYTHPPLTTIQQNTRLAGELLVENLLKLVEGQTVESFLLPANLIVRGSCGAKK